MSNEFFLITRTLRGYANTKHQMLVTCILRRCEFVDKVLNYRKRLTSSSTRAEPILFPLDTPTFFVRKLEHKMLNQHSEKHTNYLIRDEYMFILEQ